MVDLSDIAGASPALQGLLYLKILPLFKYLLYFRIGLLVIVMTSGIVVSVLYNHDSMSYNKKTDIRYTWQTWFGDVGLWSIIMQLLSAVAMTFIVRAISAHVQANLPKVIKMMPEKIQTTIGAGTGMTVRDQLAGHLLPAFDSLEFE